LTRDDLSALAKLANLKKQQELARLQPLLASRKGLHLEIASLRDRIAAPVEAAEDPGALLEDSQHRAFLEHKLRERLQALSRLEARIAEASPGLAQATARLDIAEKLEGDARKQARKAAEAARLARSSQLTS